MKLKIFRAKTLLLLINVCLAFFAASQITAAGICEPCNGEGCSSGLECVVGVCQRQGEVNICSPVRGGLWGLAVSIANFSIYITVILLPVILIVAVFFLISAGDDSSRVARIKSLVTYALVGILIIFVGAAVIFAVDRIYLGVI